MSAKWVTISGASAVREFLSRGNVRRAPHAFTKRIMHWPYCAGCGLILMRNPASQRAAAKLCEILED